MDRSRVVGDLRVMRPLRLELALVLDSGFSELFHCRTPGVTRREETLGLGRVSRLAA